MYHELCIGRAALMIIAFMFEREQIQLYFRAKNTYLPIFNHYMA